MSLEEEIAASLEICDNLPIYDDFDQVKNDIQDFHQDLTPEQPEVNTNIKYNEVTRPIPTVKGVPIIDAPIEQPQPTTDTQKISKLAEAIEKIGPASETVAAANTPDITNKSEDKIEQEVCEKLDEEKKKTVKTVESKDKETTFSKSSLLSETKPEFSVEQSKDQTDKGLVSVAKVNNPTEKDDDDDEDEEMSKKESIIRTITSFIACIVFALLIAYVITTFVAHHTEVEGSSMEENLHNGDDIIVEKVSYYLHEPERYDVIVFPYNDNVFYIKRIIGLPGESVQIKDGKIFIDGIQLWEQYGNEAIEDPGLANEEIVLRKDEYFVLGDNRNSSIDSRKPEVGAVKRNNIVGKAWLRIFPFDSFGVISSNS